MKKVLIGIAVACLLYGIEIKGNAGINHQTYKWESDIGGLPVVYEGSGLGPHLGANFGFNLTPGILPLVLALETGVGVQKANYKYKGLIITIHRHSSNLLIPLLLKGIIKPPLNFRIAIGTGPCLLRNLSVEERYEALSGLFIISRKLPNKTHLCWRFQGEFSLKIAPFLWLSPYTILQSTLTADDPDTKVKESERAVFFGFSIGFSLL